MTNKSSSGTSQDTISHAKPAVQLSDFLDPALLGFSSYINSQTKCCEVLTRRNESSLKSSAHGRSNIDGTIPRGTPAHCRGEELGRPRYRPSSGPRQKNLDRPRNHPRGGQAGSTQSPTESPTDAYVTDASTDNHNTSPTRNQGSESSGFTDTRRPTTQREATDTETTGNATDARPTNASNQRQHQR